MYCEQTGIAPVDLMQLEHKIKDTVTDMSNVGRTLLEHFRTHGTPVMIGTVGNSAYFVAKTFPFT